jgi:hypothetical protein
MRLQNDMTNMPRWGSDDELMAWGNGDAAGILDRESITTHEFGHTAGLNDIYWMRWGFQPETMYGFWNGFEHDHTGIYMRTPSDMDQFGFKKLYPNQLP